MFRFAVALNVFLGGFAVMVLEIIGARFLAKDFGGSFYVWISQIGVVLVALAVGYALGGALADRMRSGWLLGLPLALAGVITFLIPVFTPPLIDLLILRHPAGETIPPLWQKLDPVLGSTAVFFLPCAALAILPPCMIRLASSRLEHVGSVSGMVYAASTAGSIAGVFISGYALIDYLSVPDIFRGTGILIAGLAGFSLFIDRMRLKGNE